MRPETTRLSKTGLNQTLNRENKIASNLMMARGKNKFVGELGSGPDKLTLKSPKVFANVVNRIDDSAFGFPNNRLDANQWDGFVQAMKQRSDRGKDEEALKIVDQWLGPEKSFGFDMNLGDKFGGGSSSFQGKISINGVEKEFKSLEDFENALKYYRLSLLLDPDDYQAQGNISFIFKEMGVLNSYTLECSFFGGR